ncbi:MAG: sucrase ferredoxin [Nocardioidaceae bacterium]
MSPFRCAVESLGRAEPVTGTASTVRAFLLVENDGPWGTDALRDVRLPDEVKDGLRERSAAAGVRTLLVRRHRGTGARPGVRVFAAYADPHDPWMESAALPAPEALLDLDLGALGRGESLGLAATDETFFGVCTQGRHDACCAELGRPTVAALAAAHPEQTWEVSHIGGDRFAANLLVLPEGLYYGRVTPEDASELAERHLSGHLDLDLLRGRSGLPFAVQVAEVAARRLAGRTGLRDLRVVSVARDSDLSVVRLDVGGTLYDVRVRRTAGEAHRLTCRAGRDSDVPVHEVVDVRPA